MLSILLPPEYLNIYIYEVLFFESQHAQFI